MDVFAAVLFLVMVGVLSATGWGAGVTVLFLFGTAWFWMFMVVSSIVILSCIENDHEAAAFLSLVGTLIEVQLFGGVNVVGAVLGDPMLLLCFVFFYFVAGTAWSFFKWFVFCKDERKRANQAKQEKKDGKSYVPHITKPLASDYKSRIIGWMTFWPWSMVWFVINDPVRRAFKAIYEILQEAYQGISDRAFASIKDED